MFQIERLSRINSYVSRNQRASVEELSREFGVSKVTIRSDINLLVNRGFVTKTHGGVVAAGHSVLNEIPYASKHSLNIDAKKKIAAEAASLVRDNDVIILDAGTTIFEMVPFLEQHNITVVTNDLRTAGEIALNTNIKLLVAGGELEKSVFTLVGMSTEQFFSNIHVNTAFIGCDAYSLEFGVSNRTMLESHVKMAMMRAADKTVVVTDASKIGKKVFCRVCGAFDPDVFITDSLDPEVKSRMTAEGMEVIIPD